MESAAMIAESYVTSREGLLKHNSCEHRNKGKKKSAYLQKASRTDGSPARYPYLHCQALNEGWEGVDPGSTLSSHSGTLHAPELPWLGPAFPLGAQSLLQAVTQHFSYSSPPQQGSPIPAACYEHSSPTRLPTRSLQLCSCRKYPEL